MSQAQKTSYMSRNMGKVWFVETCVFLIFVLTNKTLQLPEDGTVFDRDEIWSQFKTFVVQYNRSYVSNPGEYQYRMSVFAESIKRQKMLNKREKELNGKAVYGINKFSDWTTDEFIAHLSKFQRNESLAVAESSSACCQINIAPPSPSSWDWREKHKVTSVKNQGNCGSCWAFSATGVVETQWAIAKSTSNPVELSVQEFVSCSEKAGCEGGSIYYTLLWLAKARFSKGKKKYFLLPASEYPYEEKQSNCRYSEIEPKKGAQIKCACTKNFTEVEDVLANYISSNGSVGVGVNAVMWHDYVGGIIQHHCTDMVINHAVIIEGYDMSGKIPYWIVRNSWGTDFGIDGYLYVKMYGNICGIAERVSYARV